MRKSTIARIENDLIFNGKYQLRAKEQKVVLFLISKLNPRSEINFVPIELKLKTLESLLSEKKNGSFIKEINEFTARLGSKQISFISGTSYRGKRLTGHVNWFSSIVPFMDEDGDASFEFEFNSSLKPFLLSLNEYTQIDYLEVLPLKSSFSIRMFQVFKAQRAKMGKHQKRSKLNYSLIELKELLEVENKYQDFRNFKKKVLTPIEQELNAHTSIRVNYTLIRESRKVSAIQFEFWDKGTPSKTSKNAALSFAQEKATKQLVAYGIAEGIALEMLYKVQGSEIAGFEDWYFFEVIAIFETKTKAKKQETKAGTLVNWFLKKQVFEQGDMFAKIMEALAARKKRLQESDLTAWDNRQLAKDMSAEAFRNQINQ